MVFNVKLNSNYFRLFQLSYFSISTLNLTLFTCYEMKNEVFQSKLGLQAACNLKIVENELENTYRFETQQKYKLWMETISHSKRIQIILKISILVIIKF